MKKKIGIIREGKIPPDARSPLTPDQCLEAMHRFPGLEIVVEPSPVRIFADREFSDLGITLQKDLSDCDILLGVKEAPVPLLIPDKTYLFFSHTIKKQAQNRRLLQEILAKNIRLIDYEVLTDDRGQRLIAFGYYAGIVGSHNGLWTWGKRTGGFDLPRMYQSHDYQEVKNLYRHIQWPPLRIVVTGSGRVASGAIDNLRDMGIKQVNPTDFLEKEFDYPVFTQLHAGEYVSHKTSDTPFDKSHFYRHGEEYQSIFAPYAKKADIFMNCIFYDGKAPAFFTLEEMRSPAFKIKVIADITCDIAPESSVPSTIRASKIADPVFGFSPSTQEECAPFQPDAIDVMAIDNLPSELPRDASAFFGKQLINNILSELLSDHSDIICRGSITKNGQLTEHFLYLQDYVKLEN